MENDRPKIAPDIFDAVPEKGRYETDVMNDFMMRASRRQIVEALEWLLERGHLRKCGDTMRPIYVRTENRRIRYTNIRPVTGEDVLLQMHANFATEKPL